MAAEVKKTLCEIDNIVKFVEAGEVKPVKRGSRKSGIHLAIKLNTRRLALSLGIAGVLISPLYTGSLMRFVKHPVDPAGIVYEGKPELSRQTLSVL
jgi:hypothetical protein